MFAALKVYVFALDPDLRGLKFAFIALKPMQLAF